MATSRKQSGRWSLKILLRIVCHFTCERFRSERTGPALILARQARTSLSVHRDSFDVTYGAYMQRRHSDSALSLDVPLAPRSFQALETFPLTCTDSHHWLGPRRANCTLPARLVRRWDRQERTARISGPTFRCPVLYGQISTERTADGPMESAFEERDP